MTIRSCELPDDALLADYQRRGDYTDCFSTDLPGTISHARWVEAFYTTWVFKLERLILKWAIAKPSTDSDVAQLAAGERDAFAAWRVEGRGENQLLLSDIYGRTRSWLMVAPITDAAGARTRLYFGSAVVAEGDRRSGQPRMAPRFRLLLGFHRIYSWVLLSAARSRLLARA